DEPVYRWVGRGAPVYTQMTDEDKTALEAEFVEFGRTRFLGV
ncbi:hypothetical protein DEU38_110171, partial [Rhodococcus sp. AG1013]